MIDVPQNQTKSSLSTEKDVNVYLQIDSFWKGINPFFFDCLNISGVFSPVMTNNQWKEKTNCTPLKTIYMKVYKRNDYYQIGIVT